jgi:hypothetical protein
VDAEAEREWRLTWRSMTNDVGIVERSGSRLAAGNGSSTQSCCFIGQPWISWSSATSRAMVTGA